MTGCWPGCSRRAGTRPCGTPVTPTGSSTRSPICGGGPSRKDSPGTWRAETRFDRDYLQQVLHPDFLEFGRSGRVWTRHDTMTAEPGPIDAWLADFAVYPLSDTAVLVTYTSHVQHERMDVGRRSSIWIRAGSSWQLRLHQGTAGRDLRSAVRRPSLPGTC